MSVFLAQIPSVYVYQLRERKWHGLFNQTDVDYFIVITVLSAFHKEKKTKTIALVDEKVVLKRGSKMVEQV